MKYKTEFVECLVVSIGSLILTTGCGNSANPGVESHGQATASGYAKTEATKLTPASISSARPTSNNDDEVVSQGPAVGSAEQLLLAIADKESEVPPINDNAKEMDAFRYAQAGKVIDLSTQVIAKTHDDPAQEAFFTRAVTHLMAARLEQALQGDKKDIQSLYDDCTILFERDPKSAAAAEAAYVVAKFAHTNAKLYGQKDQRWLKEFSNRARLFATHFPDEATRAVQLLYFAGWSCELNGLNDDAIGCYTLIQQEFPDSPQAAQVAGIMRRLRLQGQQLQLAGNTLEGGFVSIDEYAGKIVLVVFWDAENEDFQKQFLPLNEVIKKYEKHGLQVLGVNLDKDESAVGDFLDKNSLTWPTIFYADAKQRRWGNPVVQYYGVREIPELWLVNQEGVVVDTGVTPQSLEAQIRKLLTSNNKTADANR